MTAKKEEGDKVKVATHKLQNVCNGLHLYSAIKGSPWDGGSGGMLENLNNASEEDLFGAMHEPNIHFESKAIIIVQHSQTAIAALLTKLADRPKKSTDKTLFKVNKDFYLRAEMLGPWSANSNLWMLRVHNEEGVVW